MTEADFLKFGRIGFRSYASIPYGAEFTLVDRGLLSPSRRLRVAILNRISSINEIDLEQGEISDQNFVVLRRSPLPEGAFSYIAVPAGRLDQESERMEAEILGSLIHDQ